VIDSLAAAQGGRFAPITDTSANSVGDDVPVDKVRRPITIVTGAGRGIGAATALHLAQIGHDVTVNYRQDRATADRVVALAQASGARAIAVQADVTREDDVARQFAMTRESLGPAECLVNNAGATLHIGDLADTPVATIRAVIDVNLLSVILCARRAALLMSTSRGGAGGAIVNVSSAAATLGSAHEYVHYAAAKAGVDALTIGLAKELAGDGIRVNAVAPGVARTDIHGAAGAPDRAELAAARIPMGRAADAHEIAVAIAWLLGPEATYVTGAILRVSGGL
jgi:glucose 1-dehydrogenase